LRKGNFLAIVFVILSILIIIASVYKYNELDKITPEFRFSALNLIYSEDTTEDDLLQGIKAYDAKDGDVSDRIVIEKVVANEEAGTAVVYYAVSDLSGNVTKQSRVFPAEFTTDEDEIEEEFGEGFEGEFDISNVYISGDEADAADSASSQED